jgi:hypothetical protein
MGPKPALTRRNRYTIQEENHESQLCGDFQQKVMRSFLENLKKPQFLDLFGNLAPFWAHLGAWAQN